MAVDKSQVPGMSTLPARGGHLPAAGVGRALVRRSQVTGGQPDKSLGQTTVGVSQERMRAQRLHTHDRARPIAM